MPADIRFSVVIPAWNAFTTISDTVRSCLEQTKLPHEVIVINNGSTDGTGELLSRNFSGSVKIISLPQNAGPSAARNRGLDAATGTHIAFLDADDQWHPQKLERLADAWLQHPDAALIFHDYTTGTSTFFSKHNTPKAPVVLSSSRLLLGNVVATPTATVKASTPQRFDEQMRYCEDYDYFLRLSETGPILRIPLPLTLLGRPVLAAGGQSAARLAMRRGELRAWMKWALRRKERLPLLPLLAAWGGLKHLRSSATR